MTGRNSAQVVALVAGRGIVDAREAIALAEPSCAAVHYVPQKAIDLAALEHMTQDTHSPYKGDRAYYGIPFGGARSTNAV
jgi:uncharacterized protein (DUF427 family)